MTIKDEVQERLLQLDKEADLLFRGKERFQCVMVGGNALVMQGVSDRATHDIDFFEVPKELLPLLAQYDMNIGVSAYTDSFLDDYDTRLQKIVLPTQKIDFYTMSLEDLVLSKIAASREKDKTDVFGKLVVRNLDWGKLDSLARELELNFLSDRSRSDFSCAYRHFVEVCARDEKCPVTYLAIFEPAGNDSFSVSFPDLPGCISWGKNLSKACKEAEDALGLHLYGMEKDGDVVPKPSAMLCLTRKQQQDGWFAL